MCAWAVGDKTTNNEVKDLQVHSRSNMKYGLCGELLAV